MTIAPERETRTKLVLLDVSSAVERDAVQQWLDRNEDAPVETLMLDDPKLAATCLELEPTKPKGFQKPVRNFEVPWQTPGQ